MVVLYMATDSLSVEGSWQMLSDGFEETLYQEPVNPK